MAKPLCSAKYTYIDQFAQLPPFVPSAANCEVPGILSAQEYQACVSYDSCSESALEKDPAGTGIPPPSPTGTPPWEFWAIGGSAVLYFITAVYYS